MMRYLKNILKGKLLLFLFLILTVGCAHQTFRETSSPLDNPEHHVYNGNKLFKKGLLDGAMREFNLALELDPSCSPAYNGLGLVLGFKKDFESAFNNMSLAEKNSVSKLEKAMAFVGFMRLYLLQKKSQWIKQVHKNYNKAIEIFEDLPDAHFYMGLAYKNAYNFEEAGKQFIKVLSINKQFVKEADQQLKLVQKIERAMPGSAVGQKLALQDKLTRADAAAIFVQELKLEKLYSAQSKNHIYANKIPSDIKDHPLRADVELIIKLKVRGLELLPGGNFEPDAFITRAEYAMMIEDIIGVITHDKVLARGNIGNSSPFPDVSPNAPYFNAIMVCTTRGLINPADIKDGKFYPMGSISGSDALLVIRKLKELLKFL